MLRVHVPESLHQPAEFVLFFGFVADMFAKIELRVQMNRKVFAVRLIGDADVINFQRCRLTDTKRSSFIFGRIDGQFVASKPFQFVISFISFCIATVLFFGLEQRSIVCKFCDRTFR